MLTLPANDLPPARARAREPTACHPRWRRCRPDCATRARACVAEAPRRLRAKRRGLRCHGQGRGGPLQGERRIAADECTGLRRRPRSRLADPGALRSCLRSRAGAGFGAQAAHRGGDGGRGARAVASHSGSATHRWRQASSRRLGTSLRATTARAHVTAGSTLLPAPASRTSTRVLVVQCPYRWRALLQVVTAVPPSWRVLCGQPAHPPPARASIRRLDERSSSKPPTRARRKSDSARARGRPWRASARRPPRGIDPQLHPQRGAARGGRHCAPSRRQGQR